jgi:ribose transport system substrate-binding protein
VLKKYPGINVIGEIYGQATTSVAQSAVSNILPTLKNVDAVIAQGGGDDIGIVQAFEQSGRKLPIIQGGGSSNFLKWWDDQNKKGQAVKTGVGLGVLAWLLKNQARQALPRLSPKNLHALRRYRRAFN